MELHNSFAKFGADRLEHISVEVQVLVLTEVCATEGALECVAIHNSHFFPAHYSGSRLFRFLHCKRAFRKVKCVSRLLQQKRKDALSIPSVVLLSISIHEHIFLPTVAMQVTVQKQLPLLLHFTYQFL